MREKKLIFINIFIIRIITRSIALILSPYSYYFSLFSCSLGINFNLSKIALNNTGEALVSAVTSGSKRFFLGTDSAPHDRRRKECSCGCAGIYNAPVALSVYAKVFEKVIAIDIYSASHVELIHVIMFLITWERFISFSSYRYKSMT